VRQILKNKGSQVWSVEPTAMVYSALQLMADKEIGALLVLAEGMLVGIFSERDYARKVILHGKTSAETRVSEVMSPDVVTVGAEQSIAECMALMTEKRFRHLPVVEGGQILGVISIGDVVKAIITDQQFVIEQLESYISGRRS